MVGSDNAFRIIEESYRDEDNAHRIRRESIIIEENEIESSRRQLERDRLKLKSKIELFLEEFLK